MELLRPVTRDWAARFGMYESSSAARRTAARASSLTLVCPRSTRLAVERDTAARSATASSVGTARKEDRASGTDGSVTFAPTVGPGVGRSSQRRCRDRNGTVSVSRSSMGTRARRGNPLHCEGGDDMGATDKAGNKIDDAAGKAKEAAGKATDNDKLKNEGRADQSKADVKQAGEKVKDAFKH